MTATSTTVRGDFNDVGGRCTARSLNVALAAGIVEYKCCAKSAGKYTFVNIFLNTRKKLAYAKVCDNTGVWRCVLRRGLTRSRHFLRIEKSSQRGTDKNHTFFLCDFNFRCKVFSFIGHNAITKYHGARLFRTGQIKTHLVKSWHDDAHSSPRRRRFRSKLDTVIA